tara:strand:- start:363 stop:749 length:387 start_codon:yes stop_codon:yes gene_type:complete
MQGLLETLSEQRGLFSSDSLDPILRHHYQNIVTGNFKRNDDGSISTVFTRQVDLNGVPTLIPSVYDGKILSEEAAIERALNSKIAWPTAATHQELRDYDIRLHENMFPINANEAALILESFTPKGLLE